MEITTYGDGVDSQDKAPGKAMTYSDKYALLKAYKIQTGDDPDQNASEPMTNFQKSTISEKEQAVLVEMCKRKGLDPATTFPRGLALTQEQYLEAVKRLS